MKWSRRTLVKRVPAFAFALAATAIAVRAALPPAHVTVRVLDIGQGDAILVQDGYAEMLVDGGPDDAVLARLGTAMPFFDRTIETVVLTHPHADHFVGLIGVLKRYKVLTVVTDGRTRPGDPDYARFEEAVRASGARLVTARDGDRLTLGDRARFAVLWPPRDATRAAGLDRRDENVWSVVMRLEAEGASAYLMGDATADVEARLLSAHALAPADFLKVGHHGSRYSTSPAFLDAVRPSFAAISVGKNTYGHPSWTTLQRLAAHGATVWRTDRDGDVTATFEAGTVKMSPAK
jgi:competence protein ComEC